MKKSELAIVKKVAEGIKIDNGDVLKSIVDGFDTPEKLSFGGFNAKSYVPEIVVEKQNGKKDYFIFAPKYSKKMISEEFGKWIFFNIQSKKDNGVFHLICRKDDSDKLKELLESKQIPVEIVGY
ncbi:hypothetical protein [Parvicella tangerina]|uniref:Uncharacterized protein n=1 Tax=Parvicella tangerina TaxID=2829795 RepID=A0A916NGD9_9FLAO|nr:hypothetical protein [Parvicella tangerina]CAG5079614.1 hypothetical protein CRYO30217_00989 [Parvicella tangerina]